VAALGDGQGEEAGCPGEEAPPGEEGGGVHGRADESGASEWAAEELQGRRVGLAIALEEFGFMDAATNPKSKRGGNDADEEDGAPAVAG